MGELQRETQTQVKEKGPPGQLGLFQWRDRMGGFHHPGEMESRHLFFTVQMIWNHTMPLKTRPNYRKYVFGPYYTTEYLHLAVRHLLVELIHRTDLQPDWINTLKFMAGYFTMMKDATDFQGMLEKNPLYLSAPD